MVPLQATKSQWPDVCVAICALTKLLLDHLEDLLLVELLWKALNCGQSLATITLCHSMSALSCRNTMCECAYVGCGYGYSSGFVFLRPQRRRRPPRRGLRHFVSLVFKITDNTVLWPEKLGGYSDRSRRIMLITCEAWRCCRCGVGTHERGKGGRRRANLP